jgi:Uma2 family endonuclease
MATQSHRKFMSYEEFHALDRHGMITMLLDGEYIVAPSPVRRHQALDGRILFRLQTYLAANPAGEVYVAPLDVVLSKEAHRVIQPDVFFVAHDSPARWEEGILWGLPDLCVEVLSEDMNRYDKGKKFSYYDQYGARELWHVWQARPRIEVFRRDDAGRLLEVSDLGPGDRLATPLLPGFELDADALYADLP